MKNKNIILMSVKKKWLDKIKSGEKTIEVRKTFPNVIKVENLHKGLKNVEDENKKIELERKYDKKLKLDYRIYFYENGNDGSKKIQTRARCNGFVTIRKQDILISELVLNNAKLDEFKKHLLWIMKDDKKDNFLDNDFLDEESYFIFKGINEVKKVAISVSLLRYAKKKFISLYPNEEISFRELESFKSTILFLLQSRMSLEEIKEYIGNKDRLFGWYLTNVKETDHILKDFKNENNELVSKPPQSYQFVIKNY